jgi:hypothetical protein
MIVNPRVAAVAARACRRQSFLDRQRRAAKKAERPAGWTRNPGLPLETLIAAAGQVRASAARLEARQLAFEVSRKGGH